MTLKCTKQIMLSKAIIYRAHSFLSLYAIQKVIFTVLSQVAKFFCFCTKEVVQIHLKYIHNTNDEIVAIEMPKLCMKSSCIYRTEFKIKEL